MNERAAYHNTIILHRVLRFALFTKMSLFSMFEKMQFLGTNT